MTYTIQPGNIAAVCNVTKPDGERLTLIYLNDRQQPVTTPSETSEAFDALPLEVRAQVNKHFGTIFALPVERRGEYLKSLQPWEVTPCSPTI